jgi:AcrR family transcriptional regulator
MASEQPHLSAKRVRLRGEERRALILQSSKRVFARSGYADASTGDLARESEVTEPMLYKHFGSKKGLFLAVLREFAAQFRVLLQERLSLRAEKDSLDALEHFVDDYYTVLKTDPETHRVLFQAIIESDDPDIASCVSKHNRHIFILVRQLVERACDDGYLDRTLSLDAAAWGYMSMLLTLQYSLMLDFSHEIAHVQQEMSSIWLRGLRTQKD